jgi:RNA polymerase-binding transcription factor DksA
MDERYLEHAERLTYAQAQEEQERIRRELAKRAIPPDWDDSCEECGAEVPSERVVATGSTLCVDCKTDQEYRNRFFSKR